MDEFLKYLEFELYRSPHTIEAYRRDLEQFIAFHTRSNPDGFNPADVDTSHIRLWLARLADTGATPRSIRRKTQSLRAYFKYLCRRGHLRSNPADDIILAKIPKPLPDFVKDSDMEKIVDTDRELPDQFLAARDHLIMHLLYATGMRRAEILSLTDDNISFGAAQIRVVGKGRKERIVPIADPLVEEIIRWREMRDNEWPDLPVPRPLIATRHGAMSPSNLELIIKRQLDGLNAGRKSPHTLRHTFATSMLNGGADLNSVRAILGHTSLSTTQIYTHLQFSDIRRTYATAHPRGSNRDTDDNAGQSPGQSAENPTKNSSDSLNDKNGLKTD